MKGTMYGYWNSQKIYTIGSAIQIPFTAIHRNSHDFLDVLLLEKRNAISKHVTAMLITTNIVTKAMILQTVSRVIDRIEWDGPYTLLG